jgi:hypothetical protein
VARQSLAHRAQKKRPHTALNKKRPERWEAPASIATNPALGWPVRLSTFERGDISEAHKSPRRLDGGKVERKGRQYCARPVG